MSSNPMNQNLKKNVKGISDKERETPNILSCINKNS